MLARLTLMILVFLGQASFAKAQFFEERAQAKKYEECIALVSDNKNAALTFSRKWVLEGGGVPAQHCEALTLFEMDRHRDAAGVFEQAALKLEMGVGLSLYTEKNKDILIVQLNYLAGMAWRNAGEMDKSYNAFTLSIAGLGQASGYAYEVYIERGLVQFSINEFEAAVADFTNALDLNAEKIDAFLYRAESYRKLGEHLKARLDLNVALSLEPNHPDLLFESGVNYRMQRNDERALLEWEKLIEKYPNSRWQQIAEDNIKLIGATR